MRLPAISYMVESVIGAVVVVLGVVVAWPAPPPRPKPAAVAVAEPPPPAPAPVIPVVPPVPSRSPSREAENITYQSMRKEWGDTVAAEKHQLKYDPVRAADVRAAHLMAYRAGTVGAFEQTAGKDAAWADLARAVLELRARQIAEVRLCGQPSRAVTQAGRDALTAAVRAGCDDPLIAYWHLRAVSPGSVPADPAPFRAAVDRVCASRYPASRRVHAAFNWLAAADRLPPDHPLRGDAAEMEDRFWELFVAAARE